MIFHSQRAHLSAQGLFFLKRILLGFRPFSYPPFLLTFPEQMRNVSRPSDTFLSQSKQMDDHYPVIGLFMAHEQATARVRERERRELVSLYIDLSGGWFQPSLPLGQRVRPFVSQRRTRRRPCLSNCMSTLEV